MLIHQEFDESETEHDGASPGRANFEHEIMPDLMYLFASKR